MAFEKVTWVGKDNATDTDPRLEAAELNRIEEGIANAFSLGNDPDGTPYVQNATGIIYIDSCASTDLIYTGRYYVNTLTDSPSGQGGFVDAFVRNASIIHLRYRDFRGHTTWERDLYNGIWSGWSQVSILLETGTDEIFTYEKYSDGRLRYVVNTSTQASITTGNGGVFISGLRSMASNTYPIPFVGTPTVTANVGGNGHTSFVWLGFSDNLAARDAPPDFYICRGSADSTTRSYRVGMIIEGRWK